MSAQSGLAQVPTFVNPGMDGNILSEFAPDGWSKASDLLNPEPVPGQPGREVYLGSYPATSEAPGSVSTYSGLNETASPDGGNYAFFRTRRMLGPDNLLGYWAESAGLSQTLSGFVVGQTYEISFYQTNFDGHYGGWINNSVGMGTVPNDLFDGRFLMFLNGAYSSQTSTMPMTLGVNEWEEATLTFVAPTEEITFDFYAHLGPETWGRYYQPNIPEYASQHVTYLGMDGVKISAVPEPSSFLLVSLAGIATLRRRRH